MPPATSLRDTNVRFEVLRRIGYVEINTLPSVDMFGCILYVRKNTGSDIRFQMTQLDMPDWLRGDAYKPLVRVLSWTISASDDTYQGILDELGVQDEEFHFQQLRNAPGAPADAGVLRLADEISRDVDDHILREIAVAPTAPYIPLTLAMPGQEVSLARHEPAHLMSFMNSSGRVVAYIDQEGNYVKADAPTPAPTPAPPAPEPVILPAVSGRIIDLE